MILSSSVAQNTDAETALQTVKQIMDILKLTLHPTKTRVVDMGQDGFDFLGFHFHKKKVKEEQQALTLQSGLLQRL